MYLFFVLTSACFLIWTIRNIFFWTALWQDKEYRLDRIFAHFRETIQGRHIFLSAGNIAKWALFIFAFFAPANFSFLFIFLVIVLYAIQAAKVVFDISTHKIKRPAFTKKAILICFLSFIVIFLFYLFIPVNPFFGFLILDRLIPVIVAMFVFTFAMPTEIYKKTLISRAKDKMKSLKNIKVIAISGSYGKTSTKEYIAQILSKKFSVVKTPGSNNTPIGIAKTILNQISENTEIFVVEVGSYKIGEIKEICQIIKPQISITTSVSDQHLSLYGSIENVIASEYELISEMQSDGISLFNKNSKLTENLYDKTKHKKIYYGVGFDKKEKPDIFAEKIAQTIDGVSFEVVSGSKKTQFTTPLLGLHVVENLLPAIYIAEHLGMDIKDIKKSVSNLTPPQKTMTKIILKKGVIGIDDTFNSSPESALSALDYLNLGKGKKYFVFTPLVELGKNAWQRHAEIGEKLGKVCDHVFVLNNNFRSEIIKGIGEQNTKTKISFFTIDKTIEFLEDLMKKDDIIIFEGKEAGVILKKIRV